jgi:hypothetical protein
MAEEKFKKFKKKKKRGVKKRIKGQILCGELN